MTHQAEAVFTGLNIDGTPRYRIAEPTVGWRTTSGSVTSPERFDNLGEVCIWLKHNAKRGSFEILPQEAKQIADLLNEASQVADKLLSAISKRNKP